MSCFSIVCLNTRGIVHNLYLLKINSFDCVVQLVSKIWLSMNVLGLNIIRIPYQPTYWDESWRNGMLTMSVQSAL